MPYYRSYDLTDDDFVFLIAHYNTMVGCLASRRYDFEENRGWGGY
jgi:hypothetical protein